MIKETKQKKKRKTRSERRSEPRFVFVTPFGLFIFQVRSVSGTLPEAVNRSPRGEGKVFNEINGNGRMRA